MRYCPGNDRASGAEFPFRCHLLAAATAAIAAAAADYFFQRIRHASLAVA